MTSKYIYKITNKNNNKIYIGQSINPKQRWIAHCRNKKSEIGKAILTEGKENFTFEILEYVENYTEKENYWINFYNSIQNGYNQTKAVYSPPFLDNNLIPKNIVQKIEKDLENIELSYEIIMKKFNCSSETITKINRGQHIYSSKNKIFPISKRNNFEKYSLDLILNIIKDLQLTELSLIEIGKKYNISNSDKISKINLGKHHLSPKDFHYPIRTKNFSKGKLSLDEVWEIEKLIKSNKASFTSLANLYKIHYRTIVAINNGNYKGSYVFNSKYPLRENV